MLQLTLARDRLLCGYGTQMDPSVDLAFSGQAGQGCRPSIFFGPSRDALHLITRKLTAALLLYPKKLHDLETRLWVLALPGGDPNTSALWREQSEALGRQIRPQLRYGRCTQTLSGLERDADIYHQEWRVQNDELPSELKNFSLHIDACIEADALREEWRLAGLPSSWNAALVYWFQAEIGASQELQCTIYYEKARSLCSLRGPVCFGLQAMRSGKSLPVLFAETGSIQHGLAAQRFGDVARSTWAQAEAIGLHYSATPASAPAPANFLPLEPRSLNSLGSTDGLIVWQLPAGEKFELQFRLVKQPEDLLTSLPPGAIERIRSLDQAWVKKQKPAPAHVNASLQGLYARTLLTLRQMQDPEGGIIAAPEFHYALTHCGGYGYCWGRDAGFISYAMDVCGLHEESARFYRYMQRCQSRDGSFLHRHDMSAQLGASWGLLQPDETGSVLFGLWQHVRLSDNHALAEELRLMIQGAATWLATAQHSSVENLPIEGHDLWEEREGVHLYTVAAMAAGLESAIHLFEFMQWPVPANWVHRAEQLRGLCSSPAFFEVQGEHFLFSRSLRRRVPAAFAYQLEQMGLKIFKVAAPEGGGRVLYELERDHVFDISQLAVTYPFGVFDRAQLPGAIDRLIEGLYERLWRSGQGGIGRYEADYYRHGNPWILCTLWLALGAAEQGHMQIAKTCWDWVVSHTPAEGMLPEQVDPQNGKPSWVLPLTWSHAMFALAIHQLPKEVFQ